MLCGRLQRAQSTPQSPTYGACTAAPLASLMLVSYMPLAAPSPRFDAAAASNGARPGPPDACRGEGMRQALARGAWRPKRQTRSAPRTRALPHVAHQAHHQHSSQRSPGAQTAACSFQTQESMAAVLDDAAPDSPYDPAALDAVVVRRGTKSVAEKIC